MDVALRGPLVSIIVPVYNIKAYLLECVESLQKQTYPNIEIILIDDGSSDGSEIMCDELGETDSRIRVIHQANGGLSKARNTGLESARGKYVGFVDSDDWLELDTIEIMIQACENNDAEIAVCGLKRVYRDGSEVFAPTKEAVYNREEALTALFRGAEFGDQACTKIYRREIFQSIRYPVGQHFEDVYTTYKLFLLSNKVVTVARPLYIYRQRKSSITGASFNSHKMDLIVAIDSIQNDADIKHNEAWEAILTQRKLDAACWTLIDALISKCDGKKNDELCESLFEQVRQNRACIIERSRYRSCRLLAKISVLGLRITRMVVSSVLIKKYLQSRHRFFD